MNLPDKKLIRIEYHYPKGQKFYIEGEDLENYEKNIKAAFEIHWR